MTQPVIQTGPASPAPVTSTTVQVPETPPAPVVPAPAPAPPAPQGGDPAWLPERIAQAQRAEAHRLAVANGFATAEEMNNFVAAQKKKADAEKTETERLKTENEQLKTKAAKADAYEAQMKAQATAALTGLTPQQQAAITAVTGDDPVKQLDTIARMRAAGMLPAAVAPAATALTPPAAAPVVAPPAPPAPVAPNSAPTATAPTPPPAPGTESHLATWEGLKKSNPMLAATYRLQFAGAISAELAARNPTATRA